jgi:fermentation-respiration switch protein FrsA (DUF1100 family)
VAGQFPRNLLLPETWTYLHEGQDLPGAMEAVSGKPALLIQGELDQNVPPAFAEFLFRGLEDRNFKLRFREYSE